MNDIILSYLAGVMDSDGFFTIKRNTYAVRVTKDSKNPSYSERVGVKQTSPEAVDLIYNFFGGYRSIQKPNVKNGKPLHSVELRNVKAHEFIKAIAPFLYIKKRQAEILLELRVHMKLPRGKKVKTFQKTVHGAIMEFNHHAISEEQILIRENMFTEIRSLNDSRYDITHQALPWR